MFSRTFNLDVVKPQDQGTCFPELRRAYLRCTLFLRSKLVLVMLLGFMLMHNRSLAAQQKSASKPFHLGGLIDCVEGMVCSPNGKLIAIGGSLNSSDKDRLLIFAYPSGHLLRVMSTRRRSLRPFAFSPDGKRIAVGCYSAVQIWDMSDGKLLMDHDGHWFPISAMCFSRDGKTLVTGGSDNQIKVWDVNRAKLNVNFRLPLGSTAESWRPSDSGISPRDRASHFFECAVPVNCLYDLLLLPDDKTLAVATGDKQVLLWDIRDGKKLKILRFDRPAIVTGLSLFPDGRLLVVGENGEDNSIRLWGVVDPSKQRIIISEQKNGIISYVWSSPNGVALVTRDLGSKNVIIWDTNTGRKRLTIKGGDEYLTYFALSPDGELIAVSNAVNKPPRLRFWNLATGKELLIGEKGKERDGQ